MDTDPTSAPRPQRTSATVRDPDVADQVVIDLTERGIPAAHVTTRTLDPAEGVETARQTGEDDLAFTESTGRSLGAGWLVGALVGAVVGAIGVTLLFAPPWESPLAAGITIAVAIGVAYIAGGVGFLQAGIARAGETGDQQVARGAGRTADGGTGGRTVEVIVEAADAREADVAREVFSEHRAEPGA